MLPVTVLSMGDKLVGKSMSGPHGAYSLEWETDINKKKSQKQM